MKHVTVFFYGLFMDEALLRGQGLTPENARLAHIKGRDIRIGKRAYVVEDSGKTLWGVVFDLPQAQAEQLYSAPSVRDYRPEPVHAISRDGEEIEALCYNLPEGEPARENDEYLVKLIEVCRGAGIPDDYVERLTRL